MPQNANIAGNVHGGVVIGRGTLLNLMNYLAASQHLGKDRCRNPYMGRGVRPQ
jgi:acyl-CoA hydrolase